VAENETAIAAAAPPPPPTAEQALLTAVLGGLPEGVALGSQIARGVEVELRVRREALHPTLQMLRDDPRFAFEICLDVCGVDWPARAERFDVVYHLLSMTHNHRIRVITTTDAATPVSTVSDLWPSATWFEREAWDMYGIVFDGQPDLRRILTDYGFEGHPLRKDFPLTGFVEVRYDPERQAVVYEPVKLSQEFRNFDFLSPWEGMTTLPGDEKVHLNRITRE
jgi:NADH-quinone oxidoreductase subunit C